MTDLSPGNLKRLIKLNRKAYRKAMKDFRKRVLNSSTRTPDGEAQ